MQRELLVALTDEEKARLAEDICTTYAEDTMLEAEKKDWIAGWKARKEKNNAVRANKIGAVSTGKETRLVDCDEVFDHVFRTHYFHYAGQQHQVREMRDAEYLVGQPTLFGGDELEESELKQNVAEVRLDATLVASVDEKGTKVSKKLKTLTLKPIEKLSDKDSEIQKVMREETNVRTKADVFES